MITIIVPGDPVPHARHRDSLRKTQSGKMLIGKRKSDKHAAHHRLIQSYAEEVMNGRKPYEGAIIVWIKFLFQRPKTVTRNEHTVKPDIDNLQKIVLDAINGIVYNDDAQIIEVHAKKTYVSIDGDFSATRITCAEI